MKCPHCGRAMNFGKKCPHCGRSIDYGGNTAFFAAANCQKLSAKDIFSESFKCHRPGDALKTLARSRTDGANMLAQWRKPWLYLRLFLFLLVFETMILALANRLTGALDIAVIVGSMIVPLSVMLFIWEMDIHATITILDMGLLLLIGGILACIVALELNEKIIADNEAYLAAVTEEPTKLLVCVAFILLCKRKLYALDGLAIGAAVAAGFSFIETISYVYGYGQIDILIVRSINSAISGHILYTAPFVGALCYAMHGEPLRRKHFSNKVFLIMLFVGMSGHALNNSNILHNLVIFSTGDVLITVNDIIRAVMGWGALLYMFRLGVNQALSASSESQGKKGIERALPSGAMMLVGRVGKYKNRALQVGNETVVMGRDPSACSLVFASPTVSRRHCVISCTSQGPVVKDLGSANGTYVNGKRLSPQKSYALHAGDVLALGKGEEQFEVRKQG